MAEEDVLLPRAEEDVLLPRAQESVLLPPAQEPVLLPPAQEPVLLTSAENSINNGLQNEENNSTMGGSLLIMDSCLKNSATFRSNPDNQNIAKLLFQMGLFNYLSSNHERNDAISYQYGKDAHPDYPLSKVNQVKHIFKKVLPDKNRICLRAATSLLQNAFESYSKFVGFSSGLKQRSAKHAAESELRGSIKGFFGIGSKVGYSTMTTDKNIPPSLYFCMLVFAFALLDFELKFSKKCISIETYRTSLPRDIKYILYLKGLLPVTMVGEELMLELTPAMIWTNVKQNIEARQNVTTSIKTFIDGEITKAFKNVDEITTKTVTHWIDVEKDKVDTAYAEITKQQQRAQQQQQQQQAHQEPLPEQGQGQGQEQEQIPLLLSSNGGASRRRTRHHHQHRRKSVRRNKKSRKGRKAIKMHRTKHRVHRRKLNKSKTKQRK